MWVYSVSYHFHVLYERICMSFNISFICVCLWIQKEKEEKENLENEKHKYIDRENELLMFYVSFFYIYSSHRIFYVKKKNKVKSKKKEALGYLTLMMSRKQIKKRKNFFFC